MLSSKAGLVILFCAFLAATPSFAAAAKHKSSTTSRKSAATHTAKASSRARNPIKVKKSRRLHGQQAIESTRVMEIQQALIREHYLTGEPTGNWDETTQAAMRKYQSDQGWQTRLMPDSRALKKLGLGPDYSTAINAQGSSFAPPAPASSIPPAQESGFAAAAGVNP